MARASACVWPSQARPGWAVEGSTVWNSGRSAMLASIAGGSQGIGSGAVQAPRAEILFRGHSRGIDVVRFGRRGGGLQHAVEQLLRPLGHGHEGRRRAVGVVLDVGDELLGEL